MVMKKYISILFILILQVLLLTGCNKTSAVVNPELCGKWAYIHDDETTVLAINDKGEATYDGKDYSATSDDTYLYLKDGSTELKMRYLINDSGMYLYKNTTYVNSEDASPDSIVGLWKDEADKWSFEFSKNGTFKEDGYFPGYYTVDKEAGTVKLVYNDQFEDTVVYYNIEGNELIMEYPWQMVAAK